MLVEKLDLKKIPNTLKLLYYKTIIENPYIPVTPYPKQAIPIILANLEETVTPEGVKKPNSTLAGAGGFGGKSYLGSMLAVQYLQEPDYTCLVTRKNYAELCDTNSIWENLLSWCCNSELGELQCESKKSPVPQIIAPNGNTIYFKAFDRADKKGKFKSASYDRIINDEASELPKGILQFQYRSVRNTSKIPRSIINLSNPGGESTEYLVNKFVDGPLPYVSLDWRDNPHIDKNAYEGSLDELDYIDQQYQKYGNWHYKPSQGELITRDELESNRIHYDDYKEYRVLFNVIGIDLAGSGRDSTAAYSLCLFENGKMIVTGKESTPSPYPENKIVNFVDEQSSKYYTNTVGFEGEAGGDKIYSLRHWKKELQELSRSRGIRIKMIPASKSKFNRARPVALEIRKGNLLFDNSLDLENLFDQFIYVHPSPEVMKSKKSPDELDALGYAYSELVRISRTGVTFR